MSSLPTVPANSKSMANLWEMVKDNPEAYTGETPFSKVLLSKEFRLKTKELRTRASHCKYMAEVTRYYNSINMVLIHVTMEEVQEFIEKQEEGLENDYPVPLQQDYLPVNINPDSLPDYQTWFDQQQW